MFAIVERPIDVDALIAAVARANHGGIVSFTGVVRATADDGRAVRGLLYEAYAPLALAEFAAVAREVRQRFGEVELGIVHRVGDLQIGEAAVAIVAASAHRGAAFDACEYAIDAVKTRAPIWKLERYADGRQSWRENACQSAKLET